MILAKPLQTQSATAPMTSPSPPKAALVGTDSGTTSNSNEMKKPPPGDMDSSCDPPGARTSDEARATSNQQEQSIDDQTVEALEIAIAAQKKVLFHQTNMADWEIKERQHELLADQDRLLGIFRSRDATYEQLVTGMQELRALEKAQRLKYQAESNTRKDPASVAQNSARQDRIAEPSQVPTKEERQIAGIAFLCKHKGKSQSRATSDAPYKPNAATTTSFEAMPDSPGEMSGELSQVDDDTAETLARMCISEDGPDYVPDNDVKDIESQDTECVKGEW